MVRDTSDIFHARDFVNKRITAVSKNDGTELLIMLKRSVVDVDKLKVYDGENPGQAWMENKLDAMQV